MLALPAFRARIHDTTDLGVLYSASKSFGGEVLISGKTRYIYGVYGSVLSLYPNAKCYVCCSLKIFHTLLFDLWNGGYKLTLR